MMRHQSRGSESKKRRKCRRRGERICSIEEEEARSSIIGDGLGAGGEEGEYGGLDLRFVQPTLLCILRFSVITDSSRSS